MLDQRVENRPADSRQIFVEAVLQFGKRDLLAHTQTSDGYGREDSVEQEQFVRFGAAPLRGLFIEVKDVVLIRIKAHQVGDFFFLDGDEATHGEIDKRRGYVANSRLIVEQRACVAGREAGGRLVLDATGVQPRF